MAKNDRISLEIDPQTGAFLYHPGKELVKVVYEKDIDFYTFAPVYRGSGNNSNIMVVHSNHLPLPLPRKLTIVIANGVIYEVVEEDQQAWTVRYARITSKGYANDKEIAYLQIKISAIQEVLQRKKHAI